jgi:hypothetical protein
MGIGANTMCLIVEPFTVILISMDVPERSFAIGLVVGPQSFIPRSIRPNLGTLAVTNVFFSL